MIILPRNRPHLKQGYEQSKIPEGYDQHSAFLYPGGEIVLDYVNHERRDFASEVMDVDIPWPWVHEYIPSDSDWKSIGFFTLYA